MSKLRVNDVIPANGLNIGVGTAGGNFIVGGASTTVVVNGSVNATGTISASTFIGDGSGITGVTASGSGINIKDNSSIVGVAATIDFSTNLNVSPASAGIVTVTVGDSDFAIVDKIIHTGDTDTAIRFPAADTITAETGGSERFRITGIGSVGIGNTDPEAILTLGSFTGPTQIIRMRTSAAQVMGLDMGGSSDPDAGRVRYYLTDDTLRFFTESTHRATIDSDGLKFNTDTAAANALDDYEEGTHVPTITLGSGSISTNHDDTLSYVKVGRLVHVQGRIHLTLSASNVSSFSFTLPFANCASLAEQSEDTSAVTHVIRATSAGTNVIGIRHFRFTSNSATVQMNDADGAPTGNFGVTNPHINVNFQYRTT